jgi:hypothetical protein
MDHLIIEGCDGSGKTTLIQQLMETGQYIKHARASTSLGGPVDALDKWVADDVKYLDTHATTPYIYDRHPLISELIYGDLRENGRGFTGAFQNLMWVAGHQAKMAQQSILVICSPPYSIVDQALVTSGKDAHMPGVFENRHTLYTRYEKFVWPGRVIRYDWTTDTVDVLLSVISKLGKAPRD